jgi:uncharacterized membrane protein YjgN (DUF898 family)
LLSTLGFALLAVFGQYALYRARRYRLSRTVYRGIRFHQEGSAWRYAVCATFWWGMIALTVGLAYPWAQAALERFKMRNTFYGNLPGRFDGSAWRLFFRGLPMWILAVGPLLAGVVLAVAAIDWAALEQATAAGGDFFASVDGADTGLGFAVALLAGGLSVSVLLAAMLYPAFQAMMLRWWISGLRLGDVSLRSRLGTGQVYRVYLRFLWYAFLFAIVAGIGGAIGLALAGTLFSGETTASREVVGTAVLVVGYVIVALGYSTIYQATVKLGLWRTGVETAELTGTTALESVRAAGSAGSPVGEGLADALHVGGL